MKRIIIMALILLAACKKSTTGKEAEGASLPPAAVAIRMPQIPANVLNPYDTIGMYHNEVLWYIHEHLDGNNHPEHRLVKELIIQYALEHGTILQPSYFDDIESVVADEPHLFMNVISSLPYSDNVKTALNELCFIVSNQCANVNTLYIQIKQAIIAFEERVLTNSIFNPVEKRKILEAASVARYSAYYWMEVDPRAVELKDLRLLWWLAAITSDIAGVIVSGNYEYAADCSKYAFDLVTYSLP